MADGHIKGSTILLASGDYFDLLEPESCLGPCLARDIAHALSNLCRFTGHTSRFYSVAEHSVFVSRIVPPEDALAGLLHDAAEAFIGDVSSPLKALLPEYRVIEKRIEAAVLGHFGIRWIPETVKIADRQMLRKEQREAMGNDDNCSSGLLMPRDIGPLRFWTPEEAAAFWYYEFLTLTPAAA